MIVCRANFAHLHKHLLKANSARKRRKNVFLANSCSISFAQWLFAMAIWYQSSPQIKIISQCYYNSSNNNTTIQQYVIHIKRRKDFSCFTGVFSTLMYCVHRNTEVHVCVSHKILMYNTVSKLYNTVSRYWCINCQAKISASAQLFHLNVST